MINFCKKYETKIIALIGFILVSIVSFKVGFIRGKSSFNQPIVIEKYPETSKIELSEIKSCNEMNTATELNQPAESQNLQTIETPNRCTYLGSKNSNKYHLPTCRWAKQIKEENKVCFASIEDATAKNYLPDKNCIR